jgi:hypothetical protein
MVQHRTLDDLTLDDEGLHTPDGTFDLGTITRADAVRHRAVPAGGDSSEYPAAETLGGALLGGAIAGPIGAVAGGVLGASRRHTSSSEGVPRTVSASLMFESPELAYVKRVGRDRVEEAEAFVAAVRAAAGLK